MDATKKPANAGTPLAPWRAALSPALSQPLHQLLANLPEPPAALAVGLSGGPDSGVLACHAAAAGLSLGLPVHAWHVHHGLQDQADAWQAQAAQLAAALSLPFHVVQVHVQRRAGFGLEAAARDARYQGLAALGQQLGVSHLLLAHHQDDQAETVLMRLLRGSGPAGLAAMSPVSRRLGLVCLRPWLDVPREAILAAAQALSPATGWRPVDDPSNRDHAHTRGVLRSRVAPVLSEHWPQWRRTLARHAQLCAETDRWAREAIGAELARLTADDGTGQAGLSLDAWRQLAPDRQPAIMRQWLFDHGASMPTSARLAELLRQLRQVHARGHDRQLRWRHGDVEIRCVRGRILLHLASSSDHAPRSAS